MHLVASDTPIQSRCSASQSFKLLSSEEHCPSACHPETLADESHVLVISQHLYPSILERIIAGITVAAEISKMAEWFNFFTMKFTARVLRLLHIVNRTKFQI